MEYNERMGAIECILFVSGDPVPIIELQRAIGVTDIEMEHIIRSMDELYKREKRGIQLFITAETMQLVSNKEYTRYVEELVQPVQSKSFSQSMLETLSVIAYRQPVTKADIEAVRGVYVVTCLGCGAESRYLRRGTVVQALEEKRGGIRCRRCGGKKFSLEKRYEPQEEHT